ncbi:MAG: M56 family metallopeptidase, partial [Pirellulales bacterium]
MNLLDYFSRQWLGWMIGASWQLALTACIVALIVGLLRTAPPRLRHALWALVVIKAFLPPSLTAPVGIGRWIVAPLSRTIGFTNLSRSSLKDESIQSRATTNHRAEGPDGTQGATFRLGAWPPPALLLCGWFAGGLLFWTVIAARYAGLLRALRQAPSIDEGPVRVLLEQFALEMRTRHVPELLVAETELGPCLLGVVRPRIVLPRRLLEGASEVELRAVLAHELAHWRRRDTWMGWLQTVAQSLFWFHPFVWWANAELRHERECVCDEAVLRHGSITPEAYGESMLCVLTRLRGRSWALAGLVGVFERGAKLQNRFEEIMNYKPTTRKSARSARLAVAAIAIFLLPMSPGNVPTPTALAEKPADQDAANDAKAAPHVVKSSPQKGATDVDPALNEISVTFDRDMQKGMSWTGGAPLFPPVDKSREVRWTDARTCVLPVKLQGASYYRVGINSSNHQNFRGTQGAA